MCKCCQFGLESCYWHLIEKRFCYDETIAMYEEPAFIKDEKNNNTFDNMAFYDSVSVIAGRAIVTIDPLPIAISNTKKNEPIVRQPARIRWDEDLTRDDRLISRSVPIICVPPPEDGDVKLLTETQSNKDANNEVNEQDEHDSLKPNESPVMADPEVRRKSLRERRMSKSLYLKIDFPKELPLIRQQSMPKFYLDTPDNNQMQTTSMFRCPSSTLMSPVPPIDPNRFMYDLSSIVQIEKEKTSLPTVHYNNHGEKLSRLTLIKERIKLKRVKSGFMNSSSINLPHSHHHI